MDIQKAIDMLKCENALMLFDPSTGETVKRENLNDLNKDTYDAHEFCIKGLADLQKYRQIGTVDECGAAREKQIPKEPIIKTINGITCTACPKCFCFSIPKSKYCSNCGQSLKWGDEHDAL